MTDGMKNLEDLKKMLLQIGSQHAAKAMQDAIDYVRAAGDDPNVKGNEVGIALCYLATVIGKLRSGYLEIAADIESQVAAFKSKEKA